MHLIMIDIVRLLVVAIIRSTQWGLYFLERITRLFGIRLCSLEMAEVLKGLPPEVAAEANNPEIAEPFRLFMEEWQKSKQVDLQDRVVKKMSWRRILQAQFETRKALSQFPDVLQTPISRPVFLIGLPRTGTTLLQRLMACDPRFFTPMGFEVMQPHPTFRDGVAVERPGRPPNWKNTSRYKTSAHSLNILNTMSGRFWSGHLMQADLPEECATLLMLAGCYDFAILAIPDSPMSSKFMEYFFNCPLEQFIRVYNVHKRQLQLIGYESLQGGTYLLKSPYHLIGLRGLMEVYPDARFVFSFRPLTQVVPSFAALLWTFFEGRYQMDSGFGRRVLKFVAFMTNRYVGISATFDHLPKHPFYVFQYKDLMADPLGTVRGIYEHLGEVLTEEVEERMRNYLIKMPQYSKGPFPYTLEEFGLTSEMIREECGPYIDYFLRKGVPIEDLL